MLHTPLTKLLGIKTPVVAAAMRGASNGALAAQVSLAGGFGFTSPAPGFPSADAFKRDLDVARSALAAPPDTPLPIGAGFLGWILDEGPDRVVYLDVALAQRVTAVWLAFGDDLGRWVRHVRDYDQNRDPAQPHTTLVWVLVNSVAEAERATREWHADVLVVQGIEAGGHGNGRALPLLSLLPLIQRALPDAPPLVAAGGLVSGAHVAAVLTLGAAGAALGTRFLLTPEAAYSAEHKTQLLGATQTVRSLAFDEVRGTLAWPEGVDGRGLPNMIHEDKVQGLAVEERRRLYEEAVRNKDPTRNIVWAGTSVGLVTEMSGAGAVVHEIHEELLIHLRRSAAILG